LSFSTSAFYAAVGAEEEKANKAFDKTVTDAKTAFDGCWKAAGIDAACQVKAGAYW
jgi:hypothetical protein